MAKESKLLKVLLIGDVDVGKTSLIDRYVNQKFIDQPGTLGAGFLVKNLEVNGVCYTLQGWDTAGQERFRSLRQTFYRGADVCVLVFALNDRQSCNPALSVWKREFLYYTNVEDPETFPFVVLGNKKDLDERKVSVEEAERWCRELVGENCVYFETSAKDGTNVDKAIDTAVSMFVSSGRLSPQLTMSNSLGSNPNPDPATKPKDDCCS